MGHGMEAIRHQCNAVQKRGELLTFQFGVEFVVRTRAGEVPDQIMGVLGGRVEAKPTEKRNPQRGGIQRILLDRKPLGANTNDLAARVGLGLGLG